MIFTWPHFSPVLFSIGPLAVHYYALAYISGLLGGWWLAQRLVKLSPFAATPQQVDDFLTWAVLGVLVGGRLGYVLFYQVYQEPISYLLAHPIQIIAVWQGGMSSHGGFIGVGIAIYWFCKKYKMNMFAFADRIATVVPIGLFLGRCANFINGELWGRVATHWFPLLIIYPESASVDPLNALKPRYPSELIEATLEGVVLFVIMMVMIRSEKWRHRPGMLTGLFLICYAIARIIGECFREPDYFLGFLPFGTTMGQVLSIPVFFIGLAMLLWARRQTPRAA
ncbi:prolipoprotein diacylglyceryl transferase [Acidocella sp.]|uniref:prolipoprotein diacylglyceryl transferase n=1 Tax=Acidocella sp. TaxID=50710 RepID=UPI00261ECC4D|nr:prolipoprotein diacylglyceryl transferase [Acidocella sp.]MDD2794715.1 prolipoprotein diacylglyceryl transferase [Acidocella sp.]